LYDVADKVGNAGLIGAVGAALAALAMACRGRGSSKAANPVGFPNDASASVTKYQSAYSQLVSQATIMRPLKTNLEALDYALLAFEAAKGTAKEIAADVKPNPPSEPGE
jgi:hypothetical protein